MRLNDGVIDNFFRHSVGILPIPIVESMAFTIPRVSLPSPRAEIEQPLQPSACAKMGCAEMEGLNETASRRISSTQSSIQNYNAVELKKPARQNMFADYRKSQFCVAAQNAANRGRPAVKYFPQFSIGCATRPMPELHQGPR